MRLLLVVSSGALTLEEGSQVMEGFGSVVASPVHFAITLNELSRFLESDVHAFLYTNGSIGDFFGP